MTTNTPLHAGFLVFPGVMALDMVGPLEVLCRVPGCRTHVLWKHPGPVTAAGGLGLVADVGLADCPPLDVICVPGGTGVDDLLDDAVVLAFLRTSAARARFVASVCTGSLLLGAAGLLQGRRAACHWMSRDLLQQFGAEPVAERVVVDGNIITGGGVTAGIDFGLRLAALIAGDDVAKAIQLYIEYQPEPPFDAGTPERAGPAIIEQVRAAAAGRQQRREARVAAAAAKLKQR
ncbi:MAG: DJ-1/PfpI family protein [Rhodospirillales bacterium]|nr:MAG: DJ-1/PfpI family protein [Rhodospirillales bacterium]